MLEANLKKQLQAYLEKVVQPIEIVASLDESPKAREMEELLREITSLSTKISYSVSDDASLRKLAHENWLRVLRLTWK